jgi:hypothetical protein
MATATPEAGAPDSSAAVAIDSYAFAGDGTLVVTGGDRMLARAPDGTMKTTWVAAGVTAVLSPTMPGIILDPGRGGGLTLLSTPDLAPVYKGDGQALIFGGAIVDDASRTLLSAHAGGLVKIALPAPAVAASVRVDTAVLVAGGTRVDVTMAVPPDDRFIGMLYDAATGQPVGPGLVMPTIGMSAQVGAPLGHVGFQVDGREVQRIDLDAARIVRRARPPCGSPGRDAALGNPTPDPSGRTLVVTCGFDLVALDAVTLREVHRIPQVVPGCDQYPLLGGVMLGDARTLLLQGCGGEARLDVTTGKYACADDDGLLGAPYDMGMAAPGGRRVPAGREHVPHCHGGDTMDEGLGTSGHIRIARGTPDVVLTEAGKIVLEGETSFDVVSPDGSELAYVHGTRVVVRKLPGGEVVADFALGE